MQSEYGCRLTVPYIVVYIPIWDFYWKTHNLIGLNKLESFPDTVLYWYVVMVSLVLSVVCGMSCLMGSLIDSPYLRDGS